MANCKPGDIAIVKKLDSPNYGRLVQVLRLRVAGEFPEFTFHPPCWIVEAIGAPLWVKYSEPMQVRPFYDSSLRPIRNPGEDATDETLVPGYVKHKETA